VGVSPDGRRARYYSVTVPFTGACAPFGTEEPEYISSREGGGAAWSTEGVFGAETPACGASEAGISGFSEDLSEMVVWAKGVALAAGAPEGGRSYYVKPVGGGTPRLLASVMDRVLEAYEFSLVGFSGDDSRVVFESGEALAEGAVQGDENVYEADLAAEPVRVSLVGTIPTGGGGSCTGVACVAPEGGSIAGAGAQTGHYTQSAVSADGSRVFFTAEPSGWLYVRQGEETTVAITEAPAHFCGATLNGEYAFYVEGEQLYRYDTNTHASETIAAAGAGAVGVLGYSTDGDGVYFAATGVLASNIGGVGTGEGTLSGPVQDAAGHGDTQNGSREVTGVTVSTGAFAVGQEITGTSIPAGTTITAVGTGTGTLELSNDATETVGVSLSAGNSLVTGLISVHGVFVAGDAIEGEGIPANTTIVKATATTITLSSNQAAASAAPVAVRAGEKPASEPRSANLYEWQAGQAQPTTFIAKLINEPPGDRGDEGDWSDEFTRVFPFDTKNARVSGDGATLLFSSYRSLTGFENGKAQEFYRYRAASEGMPGTLLCVSCDPTGTPPLASAWLSGASDGSPRLGESELSRNLSENGNRLFFETPDPLVAGDSDSGNKPTCGDVVTGTPTGCDVYEWEADGEGSCASELQDGGCLYLISSGESNEQSYFLGASANGDDVLFFTRDELVPTDTNQNVHVYDAHGCDPSTEKCETGPPLVGAGACKAEACLNPGEPTPTSTPPASTTLTGIGNLLPPTNIPPPAPKPKKLTPKQQLDRALKACRKKPEHQRHTCETNAHKHYKASTTRQKPARLNDPRKS
jgi:hypothetical protein